jgi:DinB family protein
MKGRPKPGEATPYYFSFIDRIADDDIISVLERQSEETAALWSRISEETSRHRYAPDKWTIRQVLNHLSDTERLFVFRALWFARGFDSPLPSFDQHTAAGSAHADEIPWERHVEEFRAVRLATIPFFRNLPSDAWVKSGTASGNPFTVRALAFLAAGHVAHHVAILRERYL